MTHEIVSTLGVPDTLKTTFDVHIEGTDGDVVEVNLAVAVQAIVRAFESTPKGRDALAGCAKPLRRVIEAMRASDL